MKSVLVAIATFLVVATALPLVRSDEWWIRMFDFPRLQIAILLALAIAAILYYYRPNGIAKALLLVALVVSLGYQLFRIFPYTPLAGKQVASVDRCDPANSVRLLMANVLMDNRRADAFLEMVRTHEPDLVLAVETDAWWDRELAVLESDYPHAVKQPLDNTYGMHLFSKLELVAPQVRFLVENDVPSVRTEVRLRSGRRFDFYGVHPRPPRPSSDTEERDAEILLVGKEVKEKDAPAIVAGDLNDVAWSHTTRLFQRLSGTLDPRIGRGMFSTFHAGYPVLRWPLDHVFHEESFALSDLKRLDAFGSDHFPVLAELCHVPDAALRQQAPAADSDDQQEAGEKIEEGRQAGD